MNNFIKNFFFIINENCREELEVGKVYRMKRVFCSFVLLLFNENEKEAQRNKAKEERNGYCGCGFDNN